MTRLQRTHMGQWMIGLGLGVVSIAGARDLVLAQSTRVRGKTFEIAAVAGVLIVLAGVAYWAHARLHLRLPRRSYVLTFADDLALDDIHVFAVRHFGPGVSSIETMRQWHRKNRRCFNVLYYVKKTSRRTTRTLVGYFLLVPLKKDAVQRLLAGNVSGRTFVADDIAAPNTRCQALYVGGIAADGTMARGQLMSLLDRELNVYWIPKVRQLYTTPVTSDGLRVAARAGFRPIAGRGAQQLGALHVCEAVALFQ